MADAQEAVAVDQLQELEGGDILDQMIDTGIKPAEDGRERAVDLIKNFVGQILDPSTVVDKNVVKTINARIAAIDEVMSRQVDAIIHHENFRKLEGSWRGLSQLVMNSETSETLKIRVLNVSKKELKNDFDAAAEFTESALWKKVYEYQFGLYGGDPFGALVGDFEFDKGPQDIALLSELTTVAAAAHAPLISGVAPKMFGMDSFTQMPDPRDLAKIFDKSNPENTKWLSFRDSPDSRFCALVLPHTLRRLPYGAETEPIDSFSYEEAVEEHDDYVWGNAAYDYAGRLTAAFAKHHWCVAIRGPEGGGLVEGLPIHTFKTREGDMAAKIPTEVAIPDTRENELAGLGFIGLLHCQNTDFAAFFGANSVQRPKKYDTAEATANANLSSKISYLMATSRIAHYMKSICRDKIGSFMSRSECEIFLNRWISNYVLAQDEATQEQKAERPLRAAQIQVIDDKSKPGCYKAIAHLKPHFQMEEVSVSLRLVADLPAAAK
ncbi:MAG: type VI secretion system contractile sheath large subunit [Deltaproteobacteria bacterium]|nr:type VI secretion system contractile sheath large subunit [Deltaproteobacteria bacterium]